MNIGLLGLLATTLLLTSCTGQGPADIKNSTSSSYEPANPVCAEIKIDENVLSHKNISNIFDCSGWVKKYPKISEALRRTPPSAMDNVLNVFNRPMMTNRVQQKKFFEEITKAQELGQMTALSKLLEKSIQKSSPLIQLQKLLTKNSIDEADRTAILSFVSKDYKVNIENLKAVHALAQVFENYKPVFKKILQEDKDERFHLRMINFLDDITNKLDSRYWQYISKIIYGDRSPIKKWTVNGLNSDFTLLMKVIEKEGFDKDIRYLTDSLRKPIECKNEAYAKDFIVDINQDLSLKIESLKNDRAEDFERVILHGLTAYLSFQEFCGEEKETKGVKSFFNVLNYVFELIPSTHDYVFFQEIHRIFGKDKFLFLDFLNTKSFSELRDLLVILNTTGNDAELVKNLSLLMAETSDENLKVLSNWIAELSSEKGQTYEWYKAWSKFWNSLNKNEKEDIIKFFGVAFDEDINMASVFGMIINIFEAFPELSTSIFNHRADPGFQDDLTVLVDIFSDENLKEELAQFYSSKGLFEIVRLVTQSRQDYNPRALSHRPSSHLIDETYIIERNSEQKTSLVRDCYTSLSKRYSKDPSYYGLVNNLSSACQTVLPQVGYVGQIYSWMFHLNKFFLAEYGIDDFHGSAGVWAPGMLHTIFSAGIRANKTIVSTDGVRGVSKNAKDLHKGMTDPYFLESFHLFSRLYHQTSILVPFEPRIQNYLERKTDQELNKITASVFDLLEKHPSRLNFKVVRTNCEDLDKGHGADPCINKEEVKKYSQELIRVLKRKNEKGITLIQELLRWLHPEGGIDLPFGNNPKSKHITNLDEIITFLYDLSSPETVKEFYYLNKDGKSVKTKGSSIDRLEVVIRDIGFHNNFYGAYFMNEVSQAPKYKPKVVASRSLMTWLKRFRGVLISLMGLDPEASWKLFNVQATFPSLIEVGDEYKQRDGSTRTYGPLIQSLLAAVVKSSKTYSQYFNAFSKPNRNQVEGHNGVFLTKVTQMSGLRHLAALVRARFKNLAVLDTPEFKIINNNLFGRVKLAFLQHHIQKMLDQYFDNDRNQMNLVLVDLIDYISDLSMEEQKLWEEVVVKTMLLISDKNVSDKYIELMIKNSETVIKMWPEIRSVIKGVKNPSRLLKLINEFLDAAISRPKAVNELMMVLDESKSITATEVEMLLKNPTILKDMKTLVAYLSSGEMETSKINWIPTLRAMVADPNIEWAPATRWLNLAMDQRPEGKLTLSVLIAFIGSKENGVYRFKTAADELLINHPKEFEFFMENVFPALQFKD